MNRHKYIRLLLKPIKPLLILFVTVLVLNCGSDKASPQSNDTASPSDSGSGNQFTPAPATFLGFVMNVDGELIPFAKIGGQTTGSTGVTGKDGQSTAAGWYEVTAEGYATSYAWASGNFNGIKALSVTLQPVDAVALHPVGAAVPTLVSSGVPETSDVVASVEPGTFNVDVEVELTKLDTGLLKTVYAPVDSPDNIFINHPFEISARAVSGGQYLQPTAGHTVEVTLADNSDLGAVPRLFRFDPDQGMWVEEQDTACSRIDATHVSCQLSHFSQHGGAGSSAPPASANGTAHANAMANTDRIARENLGSMGPGIDDGSLNFCDLYTPELLDAFKQEIDAALAEASNPSEKTKGKLIDTAARLESLGAGFRDPCAHLFDEMFPVENYKDTMSGFDNPSSAIKNQLGVVTQKLADEVLKNPQCPDIPRILLLMLEAQTFGGDSTTYDLEELNMVLTAELYKLIERCNTWEGRIEYSIILPGDLEPEPLSYTLWDSGARNWRETHDVSISAYTNDLLNDSASLNTFTGSDIVRTYFDSVTYRDDDELSTANCGFTIYSTTSYSGNPNPGEFELSFWGEAQPSGTGSAPSHILVPGNVTGVNSINIVHDFFETGWEVTGIDPITCGTTPDVISGYSDLYRGQIKEMYEWEKGDEANPRPFYSFHGVLLPSLWEILQRTPNRIDNATAGFPYDKEFYNGQEILNDVLLPLVISEGVQVIMKWEIIHIDYTKYKDVKN